MQFGNTFLSLDKPRIMAVLNVTPDSFSDGGLYYKDGKVNAAMVQRRVASMIAEGAEFIDVGGESTRPGALEVSEVEECDRVLPVVELIAREFAAVISVDTSRAVVIREAANLGAGLINDVRALTADGALEAAAQVNLPVCLMHMQGNPQRMQDQPNYLDAVGEVKRFLLDRLEVSVKAGIDRKKIIVDPGIGFGKTDEHNLQLITKLHELTALSPVLLGVSRKSLFGRLLGRSVNERLAGSLALALRGIANGASIIRVHDVAQTADAIKMWQLTTGTK